MTGPTEPRTRSRRSVERPPVTAAMIVEAATALTAEGGLEGWSTRQLAGELEVWPRVIYHHVGDRDAVADAVADRVVGRIRVPEPGLPWRQWFEELLLGGREVLRGYRGVARRLVRTGPILPSALAIMDRGVLVLRDAGFADGATAAYRYLTNSAYLLVAVEDDRAEHLPDARARLAVTLAAHRDDPEHSGLAEVGRAVMGRGADDPGAIRAVEEEFYAYTVARSLDGVGMLLGDRA
ncbi:putative regulatory protein [Actinacidiphila reveromycinica]|uniref:Putative regulatory protein n=1 Tax=Actinacidiphila reveromycinica TaxID=659352 RepID=A0A7U3VQV2_9ACTN|nr:TetR/AcrR family transcriptional regulator C-terminal domain-containing protein [Streptomyces sp. SN-593]BBB00120.1 putative regulatory protein [Streptomyces sp. SN-593]